MTDSHRDENGRLERAEQNLELLQAQVDGLHGENRRFRSRITHLHSDREALRRKTHNLEVSLYRYRSRKVYRLRRFFADLIRGRIPFRELRERMSRAVTVDAAPTPPSPSQPAFRDIEVRHSDLIPAASFPEPSPRRADLRVAAIMDDFSRAAFSYEFGYLAISPDRWRAELAEPPDLLLVESAFGGNGGKWVNEVAGFCPPRQALSELTAWCKRQRIPTVFWNKEDPANFEWFIGAASAFDWVFTVDELSIERYRRDLGHNRIAPLPFAAQPAIHYPPSDPEARTHDVAFAGSYYAKKHTERRRQMEIVLAPALEFGLDIFDRMGNLNDPRFAWPERYQPHLRGSLTYPQTTEAYRRYKVFLNVNTVTDSPTMCARRVFELLASGTPVISGPSIAIERMIPDEAIRIARSEAATKEHLEDLLSSRAARLRIADAGLGWIESGNSVKARVDRILETIGLE